MSEFQFQKSQRVTVPADIAGAEGVQAVIVANSARLGYEPSYTLQFPSSDTIGEAGALMPIERVVGESALINAQPKSSITKEDADKLVADAYRCGADELRAEIDLERIHRAAKRKRKLEPAKSKSRKRK
jgi:hypothetical protein